MTNTEIRARLDELRAAWRAGMPQEQLVELLHKLLYVGPITMNDSVVTFVVSGPTANMTVMLDRDGSFSVDHRLARDL